MNLGFGAYSHANESTSMTIGASTSQGLSQRSEPKTPSVRVRSLSDVEKRKWLSRWPLAHAFLAAMVITTFSIAGVGPVQKQSGQSRDGEASTSGFNVTGR
jgi:hypothetical protein